MLHCKCVQNIHKDENFSEERDFLERITHSGKRGKIFFKILTND